ARWPSVSSFLRARGAAACILLECIVVPGVVPLCAVFQSFSRKRRVQEITFAVGDKQTTQTHDEYVATLSRHKASCITNVTPYFRSTCCTQVYPSMRRRRRYSVTT
ncbi:unnamed protein product, partial [Ectocarpus sp. 12 AP-2014]